MAGWLVELEAEGCLEQYEAEGHHFIEIRNWYQHQRIEKRTASKLPAPPTPPGVLPDSSTTPPGVLPDSSTTPPGVLPEESGEDQGPRTKDQGVYQGGPQKDCGPELGAYPKKILEAWTDLGDRVIQPASDIAFLSTYSRDVSPSVKGIHSNDVLAAIRSFGEIIRAPPGTYYWTARVTVGQFFQKHLEKFLPANFNPRDFRNFDAEEPGESIEDRIKRIRREGM
jgi:hypothetical protein